MLPHESMQLLLPPRWGRFWLRQPHQPPPDVSPGHWSYEAVRELAEKGIVLGNPDGQFLGDRALTRNEMATIIQRIPALDDMPASHAAASPSPSPTPAPLPASAVGPADIDKVEKLLDEYKVELTVLGTDLKQVREEVAANPR